MRSLLERRPQTQPVRDSALGELRLRRAFRGLKRNRLLLASLRQKSFPISAGLIISIKQLKKKCKVTGTVCRLEYGKVPYDPKSLGPAVFLVTQFSFCPPDGVRFKSVEVNFSFSPRREVSVYHLYPALVQDQETERTDTWGGGLGLQVGIPPVNFSVPGNRSTERIKRFMRLIEGSGIGLPGASWNVKENGDQGNGLARVFTTGIVAQVKLPFTMTVSVGILVKGWLSARDTITKSWTFDGRTPFYRSDDLMIEKGSFQGNT